MEQMILKISPLLPESFRSFSELGLQVMPPSRQLTHSSVKDGGKSLKRISGPWFIGSSAQNCRCFYDPRKERRLSQFSRPPSCHKTTQNSSQIYSFLRSISSDPLQVLQNHSPCLSPFPLWNGPEKKKKTSRLINRVPSKNQSFI